MNFFSFARISRHTNHLLLVLMSWVACSNAEAFDVVACGDIQRENVRQAYQYLLDHKRDLKNFEFNGKLPRQEIRVRRRLDRKMPKMQINCLNDDSHICNDDNFGFSPHNAMFWFNTLNTAPVITTRRIGVCYDNIRDSEGNRAFCELVGTLAHEVGHSVRMPTKRGHNSSIGPLEEQDTDAVYQFGNFAKDMCKEDGLDRSIAGNTTSNPVNRPTPSQGLVLFHDRDLAPAGRGRNLIGEFRDLRRIGWNDGASSVELLLTDSNRRGWALCSKPRDRGWCVPISATETRLKSIGWNHRVSSAMHYGTVNPNGVLEVTSGITLYKDKDFEGGLRWFDDSVTNLKELKVNDSASSLRVHAGTWELCSKSDYRGRCVTFSADENRLKDVKLNNKVTSLRVLDPGIPHPGNHTVSAPWGGPYAGMNFGLARVQGRGLATEAEETNLSWSATGGYWINEYFAVEGSFTDLGESQSQTSSVSGEAFQISGLGNYSVDEQLSLFARLGLALVDTDTRIDLQELSRSSLGMTVALGARYQLTSRLGIRGELEWFDNNNLGNPFNFTVGISWGFAD